MIQPLFGGMLVILLAKFLINDLPHAAGLTGTDYERKPTTGQLRYIAVLCQQLKITVTYEEKVRTFGEAGRMIRELEAEREHRRGWKRLKSPSSPTFRVERTTVDKVIDDLERTWHRIESDMSIRMQSALGILKEVMGYYYEEPCVVVWDNSNLVGVAVYETYFNKDKGIQNTHIKELASFTHKPGVGRLLVEEVMRIGREEGSDIVGASYGAGAKGFYEGLGFVKDVYYPEEATLVMYRLKHSNPTVRVDTNEEISQNRVSGVAIAWVGSKDVGSLHYELEINGTGEILFMQVDEEYRSLGVGKEMYQAVEALAKKYGVEKLTGEIGIPGYGDIERAKGFWRSVGFTVTNDYAEKWLKAPNPNTAVGTCYEDAWRFLIKQDEGYLIHGTVWSEEGKRTVKHAWVELPTGYTWEPQTGEYYPTMLFQQTFIPLEEHRYTVEEAAVMLARVGKHGPWSDKERMKHIGR